MPLPGGAGRGIQLSEMSRQVDRANNPIVTDPLADHNAGTILEDDILPELQPLNDHL